MKVSQGVKKYRKQSQPGNRAGAINPNINAKRLSMNNNFGGTNQPPVASSVNTAMWAAAAAHQV